MSTDWPSRTRFRAVHSPDQSQIPVAGDLNVHMTAALLAAMLPAVVCLCGQSNGCRRRRYGRKASVDQGRRAEVLGGASCLRKKGSSVRSEGISDQPAVVADVLAAVRALVG